MGMLFCLGGFLPVIWAYQLGFSTYSVHAEFGEGIDRQRSILNQNYRVDAVQYWME